MEKSNTYIFIYSVAMVVIIATLLSVAAFSLKPAQQANVKIEKMQNILNAAKIESEPSDAVAKFNEHVTGFFFVKNGSAEVVSPADAGMTDTFNVKAGGDFLPIYEIENDGVGSFVVPLSGNGLWGPIRGFISIAKADCNTVLGTVFDHDSETAGLGAEIVKEKFRSQFEGKHIFKDAEFTSVKVVKGGATNDYNEVDAISGSTKTCDGVTAMLFDCLNGYAAYFQSVAGGSAAPVETVADSVQVEAAVADTVKNVQSLN